MRSDITQEPCVSKILTQEDFNSLIGARIQVQDRRIGDLYVYGRHRKQFRQENIRLIEILADEVAAALGWARLSQQLIQKIEDAIDPLFKLDKTLEYACQDIQQSQDLYFVSIGLIDREKQIIETVYGTSIAKDWEFVAKHPLYVDPEVLDSQVDVVLSYPPRIEVISGWDARFDPMIYTRYGHENLMRAWVPMVLVRDKKGRVVEDWFHYARWKIVATEEKVTGRRVALELQLDDLCRIEEPCLEIIGRIEVGYKNPNVEITPEQAIDLAKRVSRHSLDIRKCLLTYVLETIAETARYIVEADFSALFLFFDPDRNQYVYEVGCGVIDRDFFARNPPQTHGLGQQAIEAKVPKLIPDPAKELDEFIGVRDFFT